MKCISYIFKDWNIKYYIEGDFTFDIDHPHNKVYMKLLYN